MNPPALALSAHAPDETLALGPQGPVKAARFFADAQSVAEALPASQYVLNTCHDRYLFMVCAPPVWFEAFDAFDCQVIAGQLFDGFKQIGRAHV